MPSQPPSRKDTILARAEQHFAEHGFQGASLSAIARDCEVGNPGLLHHFPSKEKLYRAVLEIQAEALMRRMRRPLDPARSLPQRLQAFVELQVGWMRARPTGFRLITRELLDNAERMKVAQSRPLEGFLRQSLALLDEAQAAGLVRADLSALALLTVILGTLNYAKIVRPTFHEAFAQRELRSDRAWMQAMAGDVLRLIGAGAPARG